MSELVSSVELKKADGSPIKFNFQFECNDSDLFDDVTWNVIQKTGVDGWSLCSKDEQVCIFGSASGVAVWTAGDCGFFGSMGY